MRLANNSTPPTQIIPSSLASHPVLAGDSLLPSPPTTLTGTPALANPAVSDRPSPVRQNAANRILVVDDMPSSLLALQDTLLMQGYEVEIAQDPRQALRQLQEAPPDLLLMDVVMPGMDGYEVVQQLRKNPNQPFTPVLFITASEPQSKRLKKLRSGAMDVVSKSTATAELLERVRDMLALKQGMEKKAQFEQAQEDDICVMSDLKTSNVAVEQLLQQIHSGALGQDLQSIRHFLESFALGNQTMVAMLNRVLKIYQYETRSKSLNFTPVNGLQLARQVLQQFQRRAREKGLPLRLHLPAVEDICDPQFRVLGDRPELGHLLSILLYNALRFTSRGSVDLYLNQPLDANGRPWLMFEIVDTGVGIPQPLQQSLVQEFQAKIPPSKASGLKLYLAQHIVAAHQGSLQVQSRIGKQTVFTLLLPAYRSLQ